MVAPVTKPVTSRLPDHKAKKKRLNRIRRFLVIWRRLSDSNSRKDHSFGSFQDCWFKPLTQTSEAANSTQSAGLFFEMPYLPGVSASMFPLIGAHRGRLGGVSIDRPRIEAAYVTLHLPSLFLNRNDNFVET